MLGIDPTKHYKEDIADNITCWSQELGFAHDQPNDGAIMAGPPEHLHTK